MHGAVFTDSNTCRFAVLVEQCALILNATTHVQLEITMFSLKSAWNAAGASTQGSRSTAAIPSSLNARLATLEQSVSAANKLTPFARRTTSFAASALPSSSLAPGVPGSTGDSDIAERVAALEIQLTQLRQPNPSITSLKSLSRESVSSAGLNPAEPMQINSALLTDRLNGLQQQIEALTAGKANKADLEALQLRAAVLGSGSSGGSSGGSGGSSGNGGGATTGGSSDAGKAADDSL